MMQDTKPYRLRRVPGIKVTKDRICFIVLDGRLLVARIRRLGQSTMLADLYRNFDDMRTEDAIEYDAFLMR
jgi:hypothetical protein